MTPLQAFLAVLVGFTSAALLAQSGPTSAEDAARAMVEAAANAATENPRHGNPSNSGVVYCGGETTQAMVDSYFDELSRGIEERREPSWFNRFVDERFNVIRDGKGTAFDTEDFFSVTPRFFSMNDWHQIASRGPARLESVGWRGCMFDHGKVWFEADGDGFRLRSINHDMPWTGSD